jgi:hypothetical protein
MGTSLNGLTPAGTYPGLIKTGDNAPIDGTLKTLSDGNGNNLPMAVSTTAVNFTNQLQQSGVAVPTASQVAAKQDTLVSGTNIKTINGTSVLGSGNIVTPSTPPSGVAGAIQFSAGSAFASDATNLFWDDVNNRLGIGLNNPTATGHFKGSGSTSATTSLLVQNSAGTDLFRVRDDGSVRASTFAQVGGDFTTIISGTNFSIYSGGGTIVYNGNSQFINNLSTNGQLSMNSTTQGFLPPRMTTTQKNAIATPAAGLVVYDSTTNKLCCYNGSTWNDLF